MYKIFLGVMLFAVTAVSAQAINGGDEKKKKKAKTECQKDKCDTKKCDPKCCDLKPCPIDEKSKEAVKPVS